MIDIDRYRAEAQTAQPLTNYDRLLEALDEIEFLLKEWNDAMDDAYGGGPEPRPYPERP